MSEPTNGEILLAIGKLEGLMVGVNQRLDTLNGRTAKTEQRVSHIETQRSKDKGFLAGIAAVFSLGWAVFMGWVFK
jgi:hypothetical protein